MPLTSAVSRSAYSIAITSAGASDRARPESSASRIARPRSLPFKARDVWAATYGSRSHFATARPIASFISGSSESP